MSTYTFTPPAFLKEFDAETIQQKMMDALPEDIDDMPGGFPYDMTYPSALEFDRFANYALVLVIRSMFAQYAVSDDLDLIGLEHGITRKPARAATAILTVRGAIGTIIPEGTAFCTPATQSTPSIVFLADEEHQITTGTELVEVTAQEAGTSSNTMEGTITLLQVPIEGITSVTNAESVHDGTDVESDDDLRERIIAACQSPISYVGNPSDYVRWAMEVPGVGSAVCISEYLGAGTVALVIKDASGEPAGQSILDDVYDHIAKTVDSLERLAPIGATLTVMAPEVLQVAFSATIYKVDGYDFETVSEAARAAIETYLSETAIEEGVLRYASCFAIIKDTAGVKDLGSLTINGGVANIAVAKTQYPSVSGWTMTEG